jgi:hypothetical protein
MNPPAFRVVWKRSTIELDLADATVTAMQRGEDRGAIADAMTAAERQLAVNPSQVGESRPRFERVLRVAPLTLWFTVHEDEQMVYVFRVVYAPPRRRG